VEGEKIMVYYAYGNDENYDPLRGAILAENLAELLKEEGYMGRILEGLGPRPSWRFTARGIREPYIEIDGIGGPVAIRKLTHLSDEAQDELVAKADKIYREIMNDD